MRIFTIALLASLGATSVASAAPPDCTAFLTGLWAGKWSGEMMGQAALFDATSSFNADGSFVTKQAISPADPAMAGTPPMVMSAEGQWTARGEDDDTCMVDLEGTAQMGDMTGMTPGDLIIIRVDDDTIRNGGTDLAGKPVEGGNLTRVKD